MQFPHYLIYSLDMSSADLLSLISWYTMLFLLGVLFFPLSTKLFPLFYDKGYGLSKILAIALTSYVVFVLGTTRVIQFHVLTILLVIAGISIITTLFSVSRPFYHTKKRLFQFFRPFWKILVFEEILFFTSLYFLSYIRAFSPDIHGLEKYMDYGFVNSIIRSDFFPPSDMWFTPFSINYYYFGHLTTALLTKLSGIPSQITYNLMLGTIFALAVTATFSITFTCITTVSKNVTKAAFFFALLSACILTLGGNLHSIYTFFAPYENESPVEPWNLEFKPFDFPNSYWYPNATRFIYNTIHEFPMYSWTVSDLHGHVLDIPYVLLTLGVIYSFLLIFSRSHVVTLGKKVHRFKLRYLLFISLLLSIMYMTNAWDGIIYFLLAALIILILEWQNTTSRFSESAFLNKYLTRFRFLKNRRPLFYTVINTAISLFIVGVGFAIFSLPFSLSFKPFVSGIGVLCTPEFLTNIKSFGPFLFEKDHCQHSPLWQIIILHGFFYFFVMAYLFIMWNVKRLSQTDIFICSLIILSTVLIIIPEFIYAKDIYPGHYRANTMFKLVFQSYMMLSLCVGFIMYRFIKSQSSKYSIGTIIFLLISGFLITIIFIYPFQAINSYYAELKTYHGLDGIKYLQNLYPHDYKAITYIRENIEGQPVILEAQGDAYGGSSSYTDYSRVSAYTGLPTVLGWTVHEWLWRGTYDIPAPRIEEVRLMYESENQDEVKHLLEKYEVKYVFVGQLERDKYPLLNETLFENFGEVIYQSGDTKIYNITKTTQS